MGIWNSTFEDLLPNLNYNALPSLVSQQGLFITQIQELKMDQGECWVLYDTSFTVPGIPGHVQTGNGKLF